MHGPLTLTLIALAATIPAMLLHELGRAAAALMLTRGRVCVLLGAGRALFSVRLGRLVIGPTARWWWGGECLHAPTASRRSTAILLAGPVAGDLVFCAAAVAALTWQTGPMTAPGVQLALWVFGLAALVRASVDLLAAR